MIFDNCDCMDLMKKYQDKHFQLALIDPPYGIYNKNVSGFMKERKGANTVKWDVPPNKVFFDELFRVSVNQIIWGGNYFLRFLGDCSAPIIWDKENGTNFFSDGEFAWTSFKGTLRIFRHQWCGAFKDSERGEKNFHPTGKPIALYRWCLQRFAKPGWLILDTHVGSASSLIACEDMGFDYVGCELDKDYYKMACERIEIFRAQPKLNIIEESSPKQPDLF